MLLNARQFAWREEQDVQAFLAHWKTLHKRDSKTFPLKVPHYRWWSEYKYWSANTKKELRDD